MTLTLTPITLREANAYVEQYHRHHQPARGCIACVAVADEEAVRGVAVVGRPVARLRAAGWRCIGEAGGGSWSRRERPRVDTHPLQEKLRWEMTQNSNSTTDSVE